MSSPDRQSFHDLAKNHSVIPVWRELLADLTTPVSLFARCVGEGEGFLLESVDRGESWGRWSFIGLNPLLTLTSHGQVIESEGVLPEGVDTDNGILKALEDLLERYQSPQIEGLPPLHGGLIGYLGYDVVREIEALPDIPEDDRSFPDAIMSIIGDLVAIDHWRQRAFLLVNVLLPEGSDHAQVDQAYDDAINRLDSLAAAGALPLDEPLMEPPSGEDEVPEAISTMTEEAYTAAVDAARDYILSGDIFQVVLSQRFDVDLEAEAFDV